MTFGQRIAGVLRLDAAVFEEIEANRAVTGQAALVVVSGSVAQGFGATGALDVIDILHRSLVALVAWIELAAVTYVLGAWILREPQTRTSLGELLRVMGFASAPMWLLALAALPLAILGRPLRLGAEIWMLAASVVAARQALDYQSTKRAAAVVLIGWVIFELIGWFWV